MSDDEFVTGWQHTVSAARLSRPDGEDSEERGPGPAPDT